MIAERLIRYLHANGIAVVSVSIGDDSDRATWKVMPSNLQAAAQPWIASFTLPTAPEILDEQAMREADQRILKALVIEFHALVPAYAGKPTLVQFRNLIINRWKALG